MDTNSAHQCECRRMNSEDRGRKRKHDNGNRKGRKIKLLNPSSLSYSQLYMTKCLFIASEFHCVASVENLLHHDARTDAPDEAKNLPLHRACKSFFDPCEKIHVLINHDERQLRQCNENQITPLHVAILNKNTNVLDSLLLYCKETDINAVTLKGQSPLHIASDFNLKQALMKLLKRDDIEINSKDIHGNTPLHLASRKEHRSIVGLLKADHRCSPYLTNNTGLSAAQLSPSNQRMLESVQSETVEQVERLINEGAICIVDKMTGETPMHRACKSTVEAFEKLMLLYSHEPSHVHTRNRTSLLPIHYAAKHSDSRLLKFLMNVCSVNAATKQQYVPLHIAVYFEKTVNVELLLETAACDVNAQTAKGDTPGHMAAKTGNNHIVGMLKEHPKFNTHLRNRSNRTPDEEHPSSIALMTICKIGSVGVLEQMIQSGSKLRMDDHGNTGLHLACASGIDPIRKCQMLLNTDSGLVNVKNNQLETPLHISCEKENVDLTKLLLQQFHIEVNAVDILKRTPLHLAVLKGNIKLTTLLTGDQRVDMRIRDCHGNTPFHIASSSSKQAIFELVDTDAEGLINKEGSTVLHMTCASNLDATEKCRYLCDRYPMLVNAQNQHLETSLHIVSGSDNPELTELLLQQQHIHVNALDILHRSPLHVAVSERKIRAVQSLMKHPSVDLALRDGRQNTPCLLAAKHSTCHILELLASGEHSYTDVDQSGNTCLHLSCGSNIDAIPKSEFLLRVNIQLLNHRNNALETPLHVACTGTDQDLIQLLVNQESVDVNAVNTLNESPLHIATKTKSAKNVEIVLSHRSIDVNLQDNVGNTVSHIAASSRSAEILELLQNHPQYSWSLVNKAGVTAAMMYDSYGRLSTLLTHRWRVYKSQSLSYVPSPCLSLVRGLMYSYSGIQRSIKVYDLDLEEVKRIQADHLGVVYDVCAMGDLGLVAAAFNGLFHLTEEGDIVEPISTDETAYTSCAVQSHRIYAITGFKNAVHVFEHTDRWRRIKEMKMPNHGTVTSKLFVTPEHICISNFGLDSVYTISHDGVLLGTYGKSGKTEAGELSRPIMCHGDSENALLIADMYNHRLQVLDQDHRWSIVDTADLQQPLHAIYLPRRLFLISRHTLEQTRLSIYVPY